MALAAALNKQDTHVVGGRGGKLAGLVTEPQGTL